MTQRQATVVLVGRPNVGKSTLLNAFVGAGLAAVSQKAQTTRQKVIGVWSEDETQLVFLDTPGQAPESGQTLNRILDRNAVAAIAEADIVLWVVEALRWTAADATVAKRLQQRGIDKLAIAVNKVDRVRDKSRLFPELTRLQQEFEPCLLFPLSARRRNDTPRLCAELAKLAEPGPWHYEAETLTPQSGEFVVAEKIREQLFAMLHEELPYKLAVTIDAMEHDEGGIRAAATIWIDRASHKPIVQGRGGATLKRVQQAAEASLKRIYSAPVELELWVKLRGGWADDQSVIRSLGASD